MKHHKREVVTRYQVTFTPDETRRLMRHEPWDRTLTRKHGNGSKGACVTLTKGQINDACDVLGINGREWFAAHVSESESRQPGHFDADGWDGWHFKGCYATGCESTMCARRRAGAP